MILGIDAQLSPHLAPWLSERFGIEAISVARLGLYDAKDRDIFTAARRSNAVVLTKDRDFLLLLEELGPPPRVLWLTAGNTSNRRLRSLFEGIFEQALTLVRRGEALVEIREGSPVA